MTSNGERQIAYPAEKARQGEIILKTRTRRMIFLAGLVGIVLIAALWFAFGH
ncbi:MAG TPA: peptide ABC transporter permease [Methylovirgula sp.]|nr:peptide ABC transporter permease [Methylovirgula sp.]